MTIASPASQMLVALPLGPEAGRMARNEIAGCDLADDVSRTAQLLVTELVANCVRHAAGEPGTGQIVLFARITGERVRVEVADSGAGFEPGDGTAPAGLGLRLVDKLATRWGTSRNDRGFRVWFEIDRRSGRFERELA
jgi:two-component sensor histidine kinase